MTVSQYVAMEHEFPTELPPELEPHRERVEFARWLVVSGLLSDWTEGPDRSTAGAIAPEPVGRKARKR